MMKSHLCAVVVSTIICAASPCHAQSILEISDSARYGVTGEYRSLWQIEAVQKELQLKPIQMKQLENALENAPSMRRGTDRKAAMQKFEASLQRVLSEDQWKRMVELRLQKAGSGAFVRKDITAQLQLSKEQQTKLQKIYKKRLSDAFSRGFTLGIRQREETRAERAKAAAKEKAQRQESLNIALDVLTDEQRKKFEELRGKPFSFEK